MKSETPMFTRPTPVLSAAAMRDADDETIGTFGIPGFTLMESAGRGTADGIVSLADPGAAVLIVCGKGNNGGDGFVIARYLYERGFRIQVIHLGDPGEMSGDADAHFALLRRLAEHDESGRLRLERFDPDARLPQADVYVDALMGTGLASELREPIRSLVERLNVRNGLKIAVDVPTGLHADLGRPLGAAFRADVTFTMAALKAGLCVNEGPEYAGACRVVDIGMPGYVLHERAGRDAGSAFRASDDDVRSWLPRRDADAHKYAVGLAVVLGGSPGMTGAPVMACQAAARAGAGYVVCGCDERIQDVLAVKMTEITTVPLPASERGIDPDGADEALSHRLQKARAVLVGCGLGRQPDTVAFVHRLLETIETPAVIDADGLNALAGRMDLVSTRSTGRWILTPHMGEFSRIAGPALQESGIDKADRLRLARHFAERWNCILLLKGLPSVVATPDGRAWLGGTGGPALATAGTGDVLAGLCAGFLAQGLTSEQAAVAALHLGGAAADRFAEHGAARSMQATDLLAEIPAVMKERLAP